MNNAIGMVEMQTVASGIRTADLMLKTSEITLIESMPVCPGKYLILVSGDISAVRAAVDAAVTRDGEKVLGSFVLGNPHESLFPALSGTSEIDETKALGIVETFNASAAIVAADAAAKTAMVTLIELRLARGMCGKSFLLLTGDVAAVTAAIERAKQEAGKDAMLLDSSVIANPDKKLWANVL